MWVNKKSRSASSERQFAIFINSHIKRYILYLLHQGWMFLTGYEIKVVSETMPTSVEQQSVLDGSVGRFTWFPPPSSFLPSFLPSSGLKLCLQADFPSSAQGFYTSTQRGRGEMD